jgi:SAM-dependent methyltransferase
MTPLLLPLSCPYDYAQHCTGGWVTGDCSSASRRWPGGRRGPRDSDAARRPPTSERGSIMPSMTPTDVGRSYDSITRQWEAPDRPLSGLPQHQKAMQFLTVRRQALDVGCGCDGRLIDYVRLQGLEIDAVDVSERMVALARQRHPDVRFHHVDICRWDLPRRYDFITAWDSIWHVPLAEQEGVLRKLCEGLTSGGVLIFTMGGTDQPGEVQDACMGVPMYTATIGIPNMLALLTACDCVCRHLEYDQYPQLHVYVIAQKA